MVGLVWKRQGGFGEKRKGPLGHEKEGTIHGFGVGCHAHLWVEGKVPNKTFWGLIFKSDLGKFYRIESSVCVCVVCVFSRKI